MRGVLVYAVQNHDYMVQCSKFPRDFDREILTAVMRDISWTRHEENAAAGTPAAAALQNRDEETAITVTPAATTALPHRCKEIRKP
jgi:hypothetical protein